LSIEWIAAKEALLTMKKELGFNARLSIEWIAALLFFYGPVSSRIVIQCPLEHRVDCREENSDVEVEVQ